jgi:phosphatidylethanolamine/phosphatidyl-N-methylethanolamine N-methyltransferase
MSAVESLSSPRGYRLFAPIYDAVFGASLHSGRRVAIDALDCRPGEHILEVGVGSGLSLELYPPGVHVTAVDLSAEMLERARPRAARRRNVALVRMNAERLALADGVFDRAVMLFAVAGLPDPVLALEEMRRVVRPNGVIVIAGHFRSKRALDRVFDALLAPIYRTIGYREDLDRNALLTACGLELVSAMPVNLFGYSSVLVCRNRRRLAPGGSPPAETGTGIAAQGCATASPSRLPS